MDKYNISKLHIKCKLKKKNKQNNQKKVSLITLMQQEKIIKITL